MTSNTEQQVTSKTPATKQKNPKRVAAGKATAEKTKIARAAQRKALIEAQSIIANNQSKVDPEPPPVAEPPPSTISTTQWLSVISIFVHWQDYTTNAKRSKEFFPKRLRLKCRHHAFCHERPLPHLKGSSVEWIERIN